MNKKNNVGAKIDVTKPRVSEKTQHATTVDQTYIREHPNYKPGVWMRDLSSLSIMEKENPTLVDRMREERDDKIIEEEIQRFINGWNKQKKESTKELTDKLKKDIEQRENMLEDLKRKNEKLEDEERDQSHRIEEEKNQIETYQKLMDQEFDRHAYLENERRKLNNLIRKRIEEQDRLLALERKEIEEKTKRILQEETFKNEIEKQKLLQLKKERELLLKRELEELSELEKHERKKKLIAEELQRSIREREMEKDRLNKLNKEIEILRQKEMEELSRIKRNEEDVTKRRKELFQDEFSKRYIALDKMDMLPCTTKDEAMCIIDPNDICMDPYSGRLVLINSICQPQCPPNVQPTLEHGSVKQTAHPVEIPERNRKLLTKEKYTELLNSYGPEKYKRTLAYQNWLLNESHLDEETILRRFPGSHLSLQIDMDEWTDIKNETMTRYNRMLSELAREI